MSSALETIIIPLLAACGGAAISVFAPRLFQRNEITKKKITSFSEHLREASKIINDKNSISKRDFYLHTRSLSGHSEYTYFLNAKINKNKKLYRIKEIALRYHKLRRKYQKDESVLTNDDRIKIRNLYIDLEKIITQDYS